MSELINQLQKLIGVDATGANVSRKELIQGIGNLVSKKTAEIGIEALKTAFINDLNHPATFVFGAEEEDLPEAIEKMKKHFERLQLSIACLSVVTVSTLLKQPSGE